MSPERLDRYVLAVLSTAGGAEWTPVQLQKMFFLLDKTIGPALGGPKFNFEAYDYGPFDAEVYRQVELLASYGEAMVLQPLSGGMRTYRLTPSGQTNGALELRKLDSTLWDYIASMSAWVRSLSFQQLVRAVYDKFPDMRANSIFQG
jgi:uncharacterized protein YwgA